MSENLRGLHADLTPEQLSVISSFEGDDTVGQTTPVTYIPNFIGNPDWVYETLMADLVWEKRPDAPRMEYWTNSFNRSYTYGRGAGIRTYEARPSHPCIDAVRERLAEHLGFEYEGCFLNAYNGPRDWLGWHADDDPGINHDRPIAVVTVGAGRILQTQPHDRSEEPTSFMLEPGSLLLMHAGMQSTHYHRIPKVGHAVKPRISLTFRSLLVGIMDKS